MSEPNIHRRVEMLLQQNRWELAERELGRLLVEDANDAWPIAMMALCRMRLGKEKEALELADRAVGLAPDESYVFHMRAMALVHNGKLDDAIRQLDEALRIDPNVPDYFELLARLNGVLNRSEKAIAAASQGLAHDPDHNGCLVALADQFVKKGRLNEAEETLRRALENNPEDADAFALLGDVNMRLGRTTEARQFYEETLRLEPGNRDARSGLLDSRRMAKGTFRRLMPLLLLGDRLTRDNPIVHRFFMAVGVAFLIGLCVEIPAIRAVSIPIALVGVPVLLALILGKPIMNLRFRRNRLQWFALSWWERVGSVGLVLGVGWSAAIGVTGCYVGFRDPIFAAALTTFLPLPPFVALITRHSDHSRWRLALLSGIGLTVCGTVILAAIAGWLAEIEPIVIVGTLAGAGSLASMSGVIEGEEA